MPGLDWDLNLEPDQQALARRLSFSDADSAELLRASRSRYNHAAPRRSVLPSIAEGASEGQEAETPVHPSQCAAPPSVPVTSSATLYPSQGEMPHPTSAPVATSLVHAPPAPLQSQQLQQKVAAATTSEYQRQLRAAMQQQSLAALLRARAQVLQLRLYTVAGRPAEYKTKWAELHPLSQRLLLRIEEKLGEYKYQSQQLDQCSCLHDPPSYNKSFELTASQIMQRAHFPEVMEAFRSTACQKVRVTCRYVMNYSPECRHLLPIEKEVGSTSTIMDRERVSTKGLTDILKEMMWNTDIALQSYVKLRPRFVQQGVECAAGYANLHGSSGGFSEINQRLTKAPTFCCYSGAPRRPSLFMQLTIPRFEEQIRECFKWLEELEQLVQMKNDKSFPESLESLPKVMSNTHDYFIHVASKVEDIHQAFEAMKTQYLNDRRRRGVWNDPFVEADKRESAKQEATVRMVHPTLHLSPPSQPTTPVTASMLASQLQQNSFPIIRSFPSSCPTPQGPLLLPTSSTQSPAPITNPFSSSHITSSITPLFTTPHGGGTTVQASTGLRTNRGRPPRSKR